MDDTQMDAGEQDDINTHVIEWLNMYNQFESPLVFIEMIETEKKEIMDKLDKHSAQLLFTYVLEDYLSRNFPELDQEQETFIQNLFMDYTIHEIIGILKKGEKEMLLNINVYLESIGLEPIIREQQNADE